MGTIFDFEMSTDHARYERRAQTRQARAARNFFDCHFAADRAAIQFTGNMAEGDRVRGFDRERTANLDAVNCTGFLDRDVAADGIAHRDCADAPSVEIAAHASD